MKRVIRIPLNFVEYSSHHYSSGYWLREDVFDWLRGEVGMGSQSGAMLPSDSWAWLFFPDQHGQPVGNMIRFNNRADAMKFVLAWL
jgi:hypothetical protein